jgi:acyl-coenzyme A thioesterase PaaI-like protein
MSKTIHAAFQWAAAEMLGGLVVLSNRTNDKYVPDVKSLSIDFIQPALTDVTSEAVFSNEQVKAMNTAMESVGRYGFDLASVIRDTEDKIVAEARGSCTVLTIA